MAERAAVIPLYPISASPENLQTALALAGLLPGHPMPLYAIPTIPVMDANRNKGSDEMLNV